MTRRSFAECVTTYGTSQLRVQCYVRARGKVSAPKHVASAISIYDLTLDGSEVRAYVIEASCTAMSEFLRVSVLLMEWAKDDESVVLAALMFDGIYFGDEIIYDEVISSIYGAATSGYGPVFAFDSEIMATEAWRTLVLECKRRAASTLR